MKLADGEQIEIDDRRKNIDDRRKNSDRRAAARRKILRGGRTFWQNGDSTVCTVHNLSDTGAQLQIQGPVPNAFDLVIDGDDLPRSCGIVWRKGNRVGVKFLEQSLNIGEPTDSNRRMSSFKQYAEECRVLAKRASPSDREALFNMAQAWERVIRRLQSRFRSTRPASY